MPTLTLAGTDLALRAAYADRDAAKSVPGRRWDPLARAWIYPVRPEVLEQLRAVFPTLVIRPEVLEAVQRVAEREAAAQTIKTTDAPAVPAEPMPVRTMPYAHQIRAYNLGLTLPAAALLMEMGTGKTLVSVALMGRRFLRGEVRRVLVVAPASVVPAWALPEHGELAVHADFPYEARALTGALADRAKELRAWQANAERLQIALTNYEAVARLVDALLAWHPDMIVADESQRIKTPGAQVSKAMRTLGKAAKYRLILTGTPVTQGPLDFWSQYAFLEPSIFGQSFYAFRARYARLGGFGGKQVVGYANLPELVKKAHSIAFRVTKAEALDLPEQVDAERYCELEPSARRVYDDLCRKAVAELESGGKITAQNVLAKLLRLQQITGGFFDGQEISQSKFDVLTEIVGDILEAGKKVVVFARFLAEITALREWLDAHNVGHAAILGEVEQERRGEEVQRFQADKGCRVLVAQLQTGGLGLTLTAADTAIFYSLNFSFADYDQCKARIHRIGQRNNCTYIHLLARNTVDERIMAVLRRKQSVAELVVDHWREFI